MDRLVPTLLGADRPRAAGIVGRRHECVIATLAREHPRDLAQALGGVGGSALRAILHQRRPALQRERNVALVRGAAPDEVVAPGQERIDPGHHLVLVAAELGHNEYGTPAIVA